MGAKWTGQEPPRESWGKKVDETLDKMVKPRPRDEAESPIRGGRWKNNNQEDKPRSR